MIVAFEFKFCMKHRCFLQTVVQVFVPGAFGLLIHAFLSLCIREISGGCSFMTGDQAFCRPLLPPACHHTAMQPTPSLSPAPSTHTHTHTPLQYYALQKMLPNTNTSNWCLETSVDFAPCHWSTLSRSAAPSGNISSHIYLQLSGCVVIAERHAGSNKVFSLHDFRWTHILIASY